jgi:hypothetical protein
MKTRLVFLVSIGAGGGDFVTGLLLLCRPAWTLRLLDIPIPSELVWLQYIGVFVSCVGLCYGYGLWSEFWRREKNTLRTVWALTALFRTAVCAFLCTNVLRGKLDPAWLTVATVDGMWAALQCWLLRRGVPASL